MKFQDDHYFGEVLCCEDIHKYCYKKLLDVSEPKIILLILETLFSVLFAHLIPWCELKKCEGGSFSEQSFETCHYDFYVVWKKYIVGKLSNPNHVERLKKTVHHFVSPHMPTQELIDLCMKNKDFVVNNNTLCFVSAYLW